MKDDNSSRNGFYHGVRPFSVILMKFSVRMQIKKNLFQRQKKRSGKVQFSVKTNIYKCSESLAIVVS